MNHDSILEDWRQYAEQHGDDNLCSIYEVRPAECREYPHTNKPGFTTRTVRHASNALACPAVFWIVEQMRNQGASPA